MTKEEIFEVIRDAKFPDYFPDNMNVGESVKDNQNEQHLLFIQNNTCEAINDVPAYKDDAWIILHTHGIEVQVDGKKLYIHNSQIIVFNYWYYDDSVEYKKSETRSERIALGWAMGGLLVGGAIGLLSSFGTGKKHIKTNIVELAYWDIDKKVKQLISFREAEDTKTETLKHMVDLWEEQVDINVVTGRSAIGELKAGVESSGCLIFIVVGLLPLFSMVFRIVEWVIL